MPAPYANHVSRRNTPQSQPIPGRKMVKNAAGGFVFSATAEATLDRFLILGAEGGTYYVSENKLVRKNAQNVEDCLGKDFAKTVARIVEISVDGRAAKNDPALFALALSSLYIDGDSARALIFKNALSSVARTGTHLFTFMGYVKELRPINGAVRTAIRNWYNSKEPEKLAYQMVKYRNRNGWEHRDILRLTHPNPSTAVHGNLFSYAVSGNIVSEGAPEILSSFKALQECDTVEKVLPLLSRQGISWEMIPQGLLGDKRIWAELLPKMPLGALVRNLGRMSANGLLTPMSKASKTVVARLGDEEQIRKSRLHPIAVLTALLTYQNGHGNRGNLSWSVVPTVSDALEKAFYASFDNVTPSGENTLLALDVSGSMSLGANVCGVEGLSPALASAAMAMVTARTEPNYHIIGFSHRIINIDITATDSLQQAFNKVMGHSFGGTDCALAFSHAEKMGWDVDKFVVYTDNDTWAGTHSHPSQALKSFRNKMNKPNAKSIVVAMTATDYTIADPNDPLMLDVAGFSTATPQLISNF